jgi:hypothetical protein
MPVKKKGTKPRASFHVKDEPEEEEKPLVHPKVSQVVEVVEESTQPPAHVEVTENAKGTKITVDIPQQNIVENVSTDESPKEEASESELEEVTNPTQEESSVAQPSMDSAPKEEVPEETVPKQSTEVISDLFQKQEVASYPEISMHKKSPNTLIVWSVAMITVAVLVGGALIFSSRSGSGTLPSVFSGSVTPTPTEAPTPTPKLAVRSDVTVEVLNGSGEAGVGSTMKALLEEKGFTVGNVGNADSYDYVKTTIKAKAGKEEYVDFLIADLSDDYTLDSEIGILPDTASDDIQVIVGAE